MFRCPLEDGGQAAVPEDCPGRLRNGPCPGTKFTKVARGGRGAGRMQAA